jgi:Ni/Co efflux regulator RcnB
VKNCKAPGASVVRQEILAPYIEAFAENRGLKMKMSFKLAPLAALALALGGAAALAEEHGHPAPAAHRPEPAHPGESHAGPSGYQRVAEPKGWDSRPKQVDRGSYQHNFQAARSFHIGPYHRPSGWVAHRWAYGQILPRTYFGASYLIADYWLFALEVPPAGYEWVRDDTDALLVNTDSGEILQVEYGVFG